MGFETALGLIMLGTAAVGYVAYSAFASINWPLVLFCLRGDI